MFEMDLVGYFELFHECNKRGLSYSEYCDMSPWQAIALVEIVDQVTANETK